MRVIKGKRVHAMDAATVQAWAADYREFVIDLGTGDGRFVRNLARSCPEIGAIGLDLCEENLRAVSREAPANALFVVADALAIPAELRGLATRVTINFPWGSLLRGLLDEDSGLITGLRALCAGATKVEIKVNAGALADIGCTLEDGGERLRRSLQAAGAVVGSPLAVGRDELRREATTWAKRLAFGRDPRAIYVGASFY